MHIHTNNHTHTHKHTRPPPPHTTHTLVHVQAINIHTCKQTHTPGMYSRLVAMPFMLLHHTILCQLPTHPIMPVLTPLSLHPHPSILISPPSTLTPPSLVPSPDFQRGKSGLGTRLHPFTQHPSTLTPAPSLHPAPLHPAPLHPHSSTLTSPPCPLHPS